MSSERKPTPSERERKEWQGPAAETPDPEASAPEEDEESSVEPGEDRGQVDKAGHVPGKEEGRRPQDRGTYADAGSRKKARGGR